MAIEFIVNIPDRPGALADLSETLAKGGVNIIGIHATPCPDQGVVQFVTNNDEATVEALRTAGINYASHEVLLLNLVHEPGALARLARAVANAGVNITSVYITMTGQIVLGANDVRAAQKAVMELDVM